MKLLNSLSSLFGFGKTKKNRSIKYKTRYNRSKRFHKTRYNKSKRVYKMKGG